MMRYDHIRKTDLKRLEVFAINAIQPNLKLVQFNNMKPSFHLSRLARPALDTP
jgi:hypothetical protein